MTSEKSKLMLPNPVLSIEEENIMAGLKSHLNVLTVLNRIVTKGANILYSQYLNSKLPKHLADYYFGALTELVTQEVRAYDPGESVDSMIFNWGEDEEPKAAIIDTWAGYCVDVKKPPPQASSSEGVPSLVSISDSLKGVNLRARSSQAGKRFSSVTQAIKKVIPRNSEFQSAEKEALTFREEAKIEIKKLEVEEVVEDKRLQEARRHIEQKRKFEQQKREEALEEKRKQLELQEKIKNFEKQKKEHGFTMDFDGNIILMNKPTPIRKKEPRTYNLDTPLKTIEKPTKGEVMRFQSEEDDKKKLSLMSTPRLITEEKSDLTKSMKFRNMFEAKPGVMMTMNHHVKSKSQTPISNRMKREDFLKILDNRKNERREQRLRKMNNMDEIQEEDIGQKKPTAEENLIIQIKQISQTNADPAVKIHNENDFIQMLVETSDKNQKQQLRTPKSHRERNAAVAVKVLPQEETQIEFFETRVINYEPVLVDVGMKNVDLNKAKPSVPKIQQALDKYNRRLMKQESWGNGAPSRSNAISTPRVSRGTSVEKRTQQKVTTLDHHLTKEPRERITVGQKKAIRDRDLAINLDSIANKFAVGSFTTRNPENRRFLIRTSNSKSRLAGLEKEDSIRQDKVFNKPDLSSINLSKLKANSSTATVAKSLQTARARINS